MKVSLPIDAFVILEGTSSKTNKDYAFVKLERKYANNLKFISDLKKNGVQVNGSAANTELDVDIS